MIYLYAYAVIGLLILLGFYGVHKLHALKIGYCGDLLNALNPRRQSFYYRLFNDYVIPSLAGILMFCVWPIAIYLLILQLLCKKKVKPIKNEFFKVRKSDLLENCNILQIEYLEMVIDPLNISPQVPFGYLNKVWLEFLSKLDSKDEIWSFKSKWNVRRIHGEIKTGYVSVRYGQPNFYILTSNIRDENYQLN